LVFVTVTLFAADDPATNKLQTPSEMLNAELPKWIRFGFDHRFRFESYTALRNNEGNDDHWLLNRLRATMTLQPASWWTFTFQGQDARIFFKENPTGTAPYTNRTDLRMAYTDLGTVGKSLFALRVGRQELAYGEERLVGASNWANVARTFDAVKLVANKGPIRLDLFAASVVVARQDGLSHHTQGNDIHGAHLTWSKFLDGTATLEPYFFWRLGQGRGDVAGGIGKTDRRVSGVRFVGKLPASFDYSTETIFQAGSVGSTSISAFATHLVGGRKFSQYRIKPRVFFMYNYASGDKTPNDGKSSTFDQLYPTAHDKTGLSDQVGWQNTSHFAGGVEMVPVRHLTLKLQGNDWHLAQARDGVYLTGGNLVYRDLRGTSGTHVGSELDLVATYQVGPHYVGGGYGRLFPGEFLKHQSTGTQLNYVYLNVGYRF
jgi:hypothetical protein